MLTAFTDLGPPGKASRVVVAEARGAHQAHTRDSARLVPDLKLWITHQFGPKENLPRATQQAQGTRFCRLQLMDVSSVARA